MKFENSFQFNNSTSFYIDLICMCFCTHSAIYLFTKLCCVKLHLQVVGFMWNQIMDRDFDTEWVGPTGLRGYGSYTTLTSSSGRCWAIKKISLIISSESVITQIIVFLIVIVGVMFSLVVIVVILTRSKMYS